jgi:hypothetical protein
MTARTTLAAITTGTANVREQIAADRNNRIWERRAAAYVDAIAGIRHRQKVRGCQIVGTRVGTEPERPKVPTDWVHVEARLIAYSSQGILAALRAASDGGRRFEDQIALWQADTDKAHAAQDLARQGVVPPAWARPRPRVTWRWRRRKPTSSTMRSSTRSGSSCWGAPEPRLPH